MTQHSEDQMTLFKKFIDLYHPSIYSALEKLTGIADDSELKKMTAAIIEDLWTHRDTLLDDMRPPAFVYKILLQHVFSYLEQQGDKNRIQLLNNILPIDPQYKGALSDDTP